MPLRPAPRLPLPRFSYSCYSTRVLSGISDPLLIFDIRRRCKSFVASAVIDSDKPQKGKRLRKHERRALAESFINKYRQSNSGKFPSVTYLKQEVGGSQYILREIIQEMQYWQKVGLSNKIAAVQLATTDKASEQSSYVKEETFICNVDEGIGGKVNEQSSDAVLRYKADEASEQCFDFKEGTSICNKDVYIREKIIGQISDAKELSNGDVAESKATMFYEQRSDAKAKPSTCNIGEVKAVKVNIDFDVKEGLPKYSVDNIKEDNIRSSEAEVEPTVANEELPKYNVESVDDSKDDIRSPEAEVEPAMGNEDEILKHNSKSKNDNLVSNTLISHSRQSIAPIAKIDSDKGSESMNSTMKDEHVISQEHKSSENTKKSDVEFSTGKVNLWGNLKTIKDRIFRFWTSL